MTGHSRPGAAIGVVIPTHSRRDLLVDAVKSCGDAFVVVVDDSPGGLRPIDGVHWVRSTGETGFGRAVNLGLDVLAARGCTAALVLNDDACLAPGALARLTEAWMHYRGVVGAVLRNPDATVASAGFGLSWWGRLRACTRPPSVPEQVDAVSGACLMLGIQWRFDPRFVHGMEDIDLCVRVRAAGGSVHVIPAAECIHEGGATLSARAPTAQRHAVAGHLRLVGGGWRTLPVLGLALAQVIRERGPRTRIRAVFAGYRDYRAAPSSPAPTATPG